MDLMCLGMVVDYTILRGDKSSTILCIDIGIKSKAEPEKLYFQLPNYVFDLDYFRKLMSFKWLDLCPQIAWMTGGVFPGYKLQGRAVHFGLITESYIYDREDMVFNIINKIHRLHLGDIPSYY